jgi:hypothetical protein
MGGPDHHDDHRRVATPQGGIHHESAVVSRRLSLTFRALTCWFSGTRRVDQRRRHRIMVVCLISVYEAVNRQTITTVNHREGRKVRDAPPEKDPIVTQFVTQGHRYSVAPVSDAM